MDNFSSQFDTINLSAPPKEVARRIVGVVAQGVREGLDARKFDEEVGVGWLLPPQDTYAQRYNAGLKYYRTYFDEALRDSYSNTLAMRRDGVIEELLFGRKSPVVTLDHHLDHDDPEDESQKAVATQVEKVIATVPRFMWLKYYLMEQVFFGKYGSQLQWGNVNVSGRKYINVINHTPVQGDKIAWKWDGTPGVFINKSADVFSERPELNDYISSADRGLVFWLEKKHYREKFIIHEGEPSDFDFLFEGDLAGGLHGVGWRSRYYWLWNIRTELWGWVLDAFQRIGTNGNYVGLYALGNAAGEAAMKQLMRTLTNEQYAVVGVSADIDPDNIIKNYPVNAVGYDILLRIIEYIDNIFRRGMLGQNLSSQSAATGLGSGVADFQEGTRDNILKMDATGIGETLDKDYLKVLLKYNTWAYRGKMIRGDELPFSIRFQFQVDKKDAGEQMEAAKDLHEMGGDLDVEDLRDTAGLATPKDPQNTLRGAQQGQLGMGGPGGATGGPGGPRGLPGGPRGLGGRPRPNGQAGRPNGQPGRPGGSPGRPNGRSGSPGGPSPSSPLGSPNAPRGSNGSGGNGRPLQPSRMSLDRYEADPCGDGGSSSGFQEGNTCAGNSGHSINLPDNGTWDIDSGQSIVDIISKEVGINFKIVGSVANKGFSDHDIDVIASSSFNKNDLDNSLKSIGFEYDGQSLLSPKEAKGQKKEFAQGVWSELLHYKNENTGHKIELWVVQPLSAHLEGDQYSYSEDGQPGEPVNPSVMIALRVPNDIAENILDITNIDNPYPLHITLAYLGKLDSVGPENIPSIDEIIASVADHFPALSGRIGGVGRFAASESSDGLDVIYAVPDVDDLIDFRVELCKILRMGGVEYSKAHGFTPHITLEYVETNNKKMTMLPDIPLHFDSLCLVIGDEWRYHYFDGKTDGPGDGSDGGSDGGKGGSPPGPLENSWRNEPVPSWVGNGKGNKPDHYAADPCGDGGTSAGFQKGNTCAGGRGGSGSTSNTGGTSSRSPHAKLTDLASRSIDKLNDEYKLWVDADMEADASHIREGVKQLGDWKKKLDSGNVDLGDPDVRRRLKNALSMAEVDPKEVDGITGESSHTESHDKELNEQHPEKTDSVDKKDSIEDPAEVAAAVEDYRRNGLRSAPFKRFFGDWENDPDHSSKVVDENGKPLVVYHGTTSEFDSFDIKKSGSKDKSPDSKHGLFFTTSGESASEFTYKSGDMIGSVMPTYLSIKNPGVLDWGGKETYDLNMWDRAMAGAKAKGHDGFLVKNMPIYGRNNGDIWVAFRPDQVKSAMGNRGTFDPSNDKINYNKSYSDLDRYAADPCGDSTGGFQPGNTCQPGGRGPSPGGGKVRAPAGGATQGREEGDGEGTSSPGTGTGTAESIKKKFVGESVGKSEHLYAEHNEKSLAASLGGDWLSDNEPLDARVERVLPDGSPGEHAIEIKSLLKGSNKNISVHDDALLRKAEYAKAHPGAVFHTVVLDHRDQYDNGKYRDKYSGHSIYYRRGSGPYYLSKMYKVKDMDELKMLLDTPDRKLPTLARGTLPSTRAELAMLRKSAERAHAGRLEKDRKLKARKKAEREAGAGVGTGVSS